MGDLKIHCSDFFSIDEDVIESYGAVNISLINDMPLFVDPFLLFNSEKKEYQKIHNNFPEVKQTWLGFSLEGNAGRGLGKEFALGKVMPHQSLGGS